MRVVPPLNFREDVTMNVSLCALSLYAHTYVIQLSGNFGSHICIPEGTPLGAANVWSKESSLGHLSTPPLSYACAHPPAASLQFLRSMLSHGGCPNPTSMTTTTTAARLEAVQMRLPPSSSPLNPLQTHMLLLQYPG